jgi:SAM-dependent methyltransferase
LVIGLCALAGLALSVLLGQAGTAMANEVGATELVAAVGAGTPIAFGDTISNTITVPGEEHEYTFEGLAGDRVIVRMSGGAGNLLNAGIQIYRENGSLLCEAGSLGLVEAACTLDASGIHTIVARDRFGNQTGSYSLHLQRTNNPGDNSPLAYGQTISDEIELPVDMDAFQFTGEVGDVAIVRMASNDIGLARLIRLYRPDGTLLCSDANNYQIAEVVCNLDVAGPYTILAGSPNGNYPGAYALHLHSLAHSDPVAYGETLPGEIELLASADAYSFAGNDGDLALVRMGFDGTTASAFIRLFGPDGTLLCSDSNANFGAEFTCPLEVTGMHTILASVGNVTDTGPYGLHLQRLNPPAGAVPAEFGANVTGQLGLPAEMTAYTFDAALGETIIVRMDNVPPDFMVPDIRLYRPDGTLLCADVNTVWTSEFHCELDQSGTFTVLAGDYYFHYAEETNGDYYFHLQRTHDPGHSIPISPNQLIEAEIAPPPDIDAYLLEGLNGAQIDVTMIVLDGGVFFRPVLSVYRPDGSLLCTAEVIISPVNLVCTLDEDGTFTIFAKSATGSQSSDYNLFAFCDSCPGGGSRIFLPLMTRE